MKANDKKKVIPLEAADLTAGGCRAGFRFKTVIPGVARDWVTSR